MTEANDLTPEIVEEGKTLPEASGIAAVIRKRWSPRAFGDREISSSDLEKLFVAASWAASSSNEQPWRFIVGRHGDERYTKIFAALVEFNQSWAGSAPILILAIAKKTSEKGGQNKFALHDTGAATAYLALQATELGFHTHSMAGFDSDLLRASFAIPSEYELGSVTAVGYFGDPASLPERMQRTEIAPRARKSVGEFVFSDWEVPAVF